MIDGHWQCRCITEEQAAHVDDGCNGHYRIDERGETQCADTSIDVSITRHDDTVELHLPRRARRELAVSRAGSTRAARRVGEVRFKSDPAPLLSILNTPARTAQPD
jgi:hypothetical protein